MEENWLVLSMYKYCRVEWTGNVLVCSGYCLALCLTRLEKLVPDIPLMSMYDGIRLLLPILRQKMMQSGV
jgi:hypothetical protein